MIPDECANYKRNKSCTALRSYLPSLGTSLISYAPPSRCSYPNVTFIRNLSRLFLCASFISGRLLSKHLSATKITLLMSFTFSSLILTMVNSSTNCRRTWSHLLWRVLKTSVSDINQSFYNNASLDIVTECFKISCTLPECINIFVTVMNQDWNQKHKRIHCIISCLKAPWKQKVSPEHNGKYRSISNNENSN